MDINALKTFLEVAKTRHFGHAANALFVSQSTVSARIRALEGELGVELFIRERGNIRLSAGGNALITHAKGMMTLWTRAKREVSVPQGVHQTLSFGGLSGLWDITLQDWLLKLSVSHPQLAITADIYNTKTMLTRVIDGSLDVAFIYDAPQGVNLVSRELRPIKLRLVSSHPVKQLSDDWAEKFIAVYWGMNFSVQFATKFPDVKSSKLSTSLGRIAQEHLRCSSGYAYLAEPAVRTAVERGELHYVPDTPVFERKAYAIYHQENEKKSLISRLVEPL